MNLNTPVQAKELNQAEALKIANEIVRLEATVKEMKNQLKVYVEENGAVETDDRVWGFNESISWDFKGTALKELLTMITLEGYNAWEMLSLTKRSLDQLGWDDSFLQQYGEKKVTKRFSSKKK